MSYIKLVLLLFFATGIIFSGFLFFTAAEEQNTSTKNSNTDKKIANYINSEDLMTQAMEVDFFSKNAPFNNPINKDVEIDPNSFHMISGLADSGDFIIAFKQYNPSIYFVDNDTPVQDVMLTCGKDWGLGVNTLNAVPIPEGAKPTFDKDGADNSPKGCGEDSDQDNQLVIIDIANGCEYDLWQARKENGQWVASWASAIPLDSDGIFPTGLSSRGSGFALSAGIILPWELEKGEINHALIFSYPLTKAGGPVPPASESDGESEDPRAMPEGARLQLDPSINLEELKLSSYEKVIARTLQKYGMFLVDNGGDTGVAIYAANPQSFPINSYKGLPMDDYIFLPNIPLDKFRVIKLPPQNPNPTISLPNNRCVKYLN